MTLRGLKVCIVGPLPPPSGGMANQTRQLAELLEREGAAVAVVQVNAPYPFALIGRIPMVRALFTRALHCRSEALEKAPLKVTVVQWKVEEDRAKDERRRDERAKFVSLFGGLGCELEFTTDGFGAFLDAWDATRRAR